MGITSKYGGVKRYVQRCHVRRLEQARIDAERAAAVANPTFCYRYYSPSGNSQGELWARDDAAAQIQCDRMFPGGGYYAKRI